MRVAVGRAHFNRVLLGRGVVGHLEYGDVKCAAAQVVYDDLFVLLAVESVRERGRGRLVDDTAHVQARDFAGELGRLALRVIEIRRNRDHGFGDLFADLCFRIDLKLLQHHGGDFFRRVLLSAHDDPYALVLFHDFVRKPLRIALYLFVRPAATYETLHREQRVLRIHDGLPFRHLSGQTLAGFCDGDDGRRRPASFGAFQDFRLAAFNHGHAGVGRSKIDSENF